VFIINCSYKFPLNKRLKLIEKVVQFDWAPWIT